MNIVLFYDKKHHHTFLLSDSSDNLEDDLSEFGDSEEHDSSEFFTGANPSESDNSITDASDSGDDDDDEQVEVTDPKDYFDNEEDDGILHDVPLAECGKKYLTFLMQ